jgi:hypothetical protein
MPGVWRQSICSGGNHMLEWYPRLVATMCTLIALAALLGHAVGPDRGFNW